MSYNSNVLKKYLTDVFVETGSGQGHGIQHALDAGFKEVYSIDVYRPCYEMCMERFGSNPSVHLFLGDSATKLYSIIKNINKRITFGLDAHMSGAGTSFGPTSYIPTIDEICQIKLHYLKNHNILVDDRRLYGTPEFLNLPESSVRMEILSIHPDYRISFENGHSINDIIVGQNKWFIKG